MAIRDDEELQELANGAINFFAGARPNDIIDGFEATGRMDKKTADAMRELFAKEQEAAAGGTQGGGRRHQRVITIPDSSRKTRGSEARAQGDAMRDALRQKGDVPVGIPKAFVNRVQPSQIAESRVVGKGDVKSGLEQLEFIQSIPGGAGGENIAGLSELIKVDIGSGARVTKTFNDPTSLATMMINKGALQSTSAVKLAKKRIGPLEITVFTDRKTADLARLITGKLKARASGTHKKSIASRFRKKRRQR